MAENGYGSHCTTVATSGTCKIDACSEKQDQSLYAPEVNCAGYVQNILDSCPWDDEGRVGGQIHPADCNKAYPGKDYRIQVSTKK